MLSQAFFQSQLYYLALIYCGKSTVALKSLQRISNKAFKVVFNLPLLYSTLSLYQDVAKNILPLRGIYIFILIYINLI